VSRPRLLITSGPTREYLDPVRYLSNGSSGQMGCCLAFSALEKGYDVTIVSGPVSIDYPKAATVVNVVSTQEMFDAVMEHWSTCKGMIAAAAPSDFRPKEFSKSKIKKSTGANGLSIELIENPDILAEAGRCKSDSQWTIGFALETNDGPTNAIGKLKRKNCNFIVLNDPSAIDSGANCISVFDETGDQVIDSFSGPKQEVANRILSLV
jgi:phosphopantothenoylcysteine decarboxylase/phosphopantothenate--cysteine ligase